MLKDVRIAVQGDIIHQQTGCVEGTTLRVLQLIEKLGISYDDMLNNRFISLIFSQSIK
jgi:hypothetical protein